MPRPSMAKSSSRTRMVWICGGVSQLHFYRYPGGFRDQVALETRTKLAERFASTRRLTIEGVQVSIGQGVAVLGAVVGVCLLTSVLSPAQYGEVALAGTAGALVTQLSLG